MTPLLSAGCVLLAVSAAAAVLFLSEGVAADPFWGADPAWSLIHEPAVEQELKLSPAKSRELRSRSLLDGLDASFSATQQATGRSRQRGFVQVHDDRDIFQASPVELPAIDIRSP